jgi:hypothetical protein
MTEISKRFEDFIRTENKKLAEKEYLMPIKTEKGICVGDVLIETQRNLKNIKKDNLCYDSIFLNSAAVKIANLLALNKSSDRIDKLYQADQLYGRWFVESQSLLEIHQKLKKSKEYERADVIWAKYQESRDKAESARIKVNQLCSTPINKL